MENTLADNPCRICGNIKNNKIYSVSEFHHGLKDEFDYIECADCGCLQIKEIPDNMERYYPSDYYSFNGKLYDKKSFKETIRCLAIRNFIRLRLKGSRFIQLMNERIYPHHSWLKKSLCDYTSSILDVGCGNGSLLLKMQKFGFKNLMGVDPFISKKKLFMIPI